MQYILIMLVVSGLLYGCNPESDKIGSEGGGGKSEQKVCGQGEMICEEGGECVSLSSDENCGKCGWKCGVDERCNGVGCVLKDKSKQPSDKDDSNPEEPKCDESLCHAGEKCIDDVCVCVDGDCVCGDVKCSVGEHCDDVECLCGETKCGVGEKCVRGQCMCGGEKLCGVGMVCSDKGLCVCDEGHFDCNENMEDGCESVEQCKCKRGVDLAWCYGRVDNLSYVPIPESDRGLGLEALQGMGKDKFVKQIHGHCKVGVARCSDGMNYGVCEGLVAPERRVSCTEEGKSIINELGVNLTTLDNDCDGVADGCVTACDSKIDSDSYVGCQFWTAYMDNLARRDAPAEANFSLVFSNANKEKARVRVFVEDRLFQSVEVAGGSVYELELFRLDHMIESSGQHKLGVYINSTEPLTVYQFNPMGNPQAYSNDASLLLPLNVLGRHYISINYDGPGFSHSKDTVIINAHHEGQTKIHVWKTGVLSSESPLEYTLSPYELVNLSDSEKSAKGSGIMVSSDRPVAVLSGNRCMSTGEGFTCCCDHLEEYLFPVKSWGTSYHMVRTRKLGKEGVYWTIVAAEDNTRIDFSSRDVSESKVLQARESFVFQSTEFFEVWSSDASGGSARKPILVAMTMPSAGETKVTGHDVGDPALMLVVPKEQYRKRYGFAVPSGYTKNWITIVAPLGSIIKLDGLVKDVNLIGFGEKNAQGNYKYGFGYLLVEKGIHYLESDQPMAAYGNGIHLHVSYAYALGLDLKAISVEKALPPPAVN